MPHLRKRSKTVHMRSYLYEILEQRQVLAASAIVSNGALSVLGDGDSNNIAIFGQNVSSAWYLVVKDGNTTIFDGTPTGQNVLASSVASIDVSAGLGDDIINVSQVSAAIGFAGLTNLTLSGEQGNDTVVGSAFDDTLLGGAGTDLLVGGGGNDAIDGGADEDTYYFSGQTLGSDTIAASSGGIGDALHFRDFESAVKLDLSASTSQTVSTGNLQLTLNSGSTFRYLFDSPFSDSLTGSSSDETFVLSAGDDTVAGGDGDDAYLFSEGANGNDFLIEATGEGQDWLSFADATAAVTLCLSTSGSQEWGEGTLILADPQQLEHIVGSSYDDFLAGNDSQNYLLGGEGSDTVLGHAQADFLSGDTGNDLIVGGDGNDIVLGGVGSDNLSGDLNQDIIISGDYVPNIVFDSLQDIGVIIDDLMQAWAGQSSFSDRLANMMGSSGALDPLPDELKLVPGATLVNDTDIDVLLLLAGSDAVFLDSATDMVFHADPSQATYLLINPSWNPINATFSNGLLTVSNRGTDDVVYSVVNGNLLVNGVHPLGTPLLATNVVQVLTQLGPLAGELYDESLFSETLPTFVASAWTRTDPMQAAIFDATIVDQSLINQAGANWSNYTGYTAQDIADANNAGNFDLFWEVVCAARTDAGGGGGNMMAPTGPAQPTVSDANAVNGYFFGKPGIGYEPPVTKPISWDEIADGLADGDFGILAEARNTILNSNGQMSAMSAESSGQEGGTLDIQDSSADEGYAIGFKIEFNAEYFNGCSVNWQTSNGSAISGTAFCNGDYQAGNGSLTWLEGHEGDGGVGVSTFSDYRLESDETMQVTLSNLDNFDGEEGDMSIGRSTGTGTINNTTTKPVVSISGDVGVEGEFLWFEVTLSHPIQDESITVNWTAIDITTSGTQDYSPSSGTLTFNPLTCTQPGDVIKTFSVFAKVDKLLEGDETFKARVASGANATTSSPTNEAVGTIHDGINMIGYRPQTEGVLYGNPFQRTAIPDDEEEDPGVYVRRNGDDDNGNSTPDRQDTLISAQENDLIEVSLSGAIPAGATIHIRRSSGDIQVWNTYAKGYAFFSGSNQNSIISSTGELWIEWVGGGTGTAAATLETVVVKDGVELGVTDVLVIHPFTSVVIVLGGEFQNPSDPAHPDRGTFQSAIDLYREGYDVHMYNESTVGAGVGGAPYWEVVNAVQNRGVTSVSMFGYSHGGGSVYYLSSHLDSNRQSIGSFTINYTAYIDGVDDYAIWVAETRRAPGTLWQVSIYQHGSAEDGYLHGGPVVNGDDNIDAEDGWDLPLTHSNIDDHELIRDYIKEGLKARTSR